MRIGTYDAQWLRDRLWEYEQRYALMTQDFIACYTGKAPDVLLSHVPHSEQHTWSSYAQELQELEHHG